MSRQPNIVGCSINLDNRPNSREVQFATIFVFRRDASSA
jgi:hypothetical protein